jgi:hypothetical protein
MSWLAGCSDRSGVVEGRRVRDIDYSTSLLIFPSMLGRLLPLLALKFALSLSMKYGVSVLF